MSDNPRDNSSRLVSFILPCLCLAVTLTAFGLGAPVKLARLVQAPSPVLADLEFDATIRYEPVVSADLSAFELVAAKRVLDGLVSEQFLAFK